MIQPLRFLIAESEPPEARSKRRDSVGKSSGETYLAVLDHLWPAARCDRITPADSGAKLPPQGTIEGYDAVILTGSPLHVYDDTPETRRELDFMRAVFRSGTPAFGSCAGLQIAAVAAGGVARPMGKRREAGFARRIYPTDAGRVHPLLDGRPPAFDAPAIHTDEVAQLPGGGALLASNGASRVQAAEIRHEGGVFWGVQYHPEIDLFEVSAALRRQSGDLVEHGLAANADAVTAQADRIEALHADTSRVDLAWSLGLDEDVLRPELRTLEIRNFIRHLVQPTRSKRARV